MPHCRDAPHIPSSVRFVFSVVNFSNANSAANLLYGAWCAALSAPVLAHVRSCPALRLLGGLEQGIGLSGPIQRRVDSGLRADDQDVVLDLRALLAELLERLRSARGDAERHWHLAPDRGAEIIGDRVAV